MTIVLDGTNGVTAPTLASSGPVTGTTASFSGDVTLGTSVLATPAGSAPSYTCRAWVNFNGTGTVAIRAGGNVSSITDNGTGDYTVNFATALPDADYAAMVSGNGATVGDFNNVLNVPYAQVPTTSAVRFRNVDSGGVVAARDLIYAYVSIFR